jgi:hypothetical protein
MNCKTVRAELRQRGLLLMQDKRLPSVAGIITGQSLATSWWTHARAHEIFACIESLDADPDVLTTRLVAGRVTYVDRSLARAFISIATAGEPWQTRGLSREARTLLARVPIQAKGAPIRELQERLLVAAHEVHTDSGRHEILIDRWSGDAGMAPAIARETLERAAAAIGATPKTLPWNRLARR